MRRTVLTSIALVSLSALTIAIGACATAPIDDGFDGLTREQNSTDPGEQRSSAKLPPSTQGTDEPRDAGANTNEPKDAGAPKDASTPPADSGTNPPPTTTDDCDPNDFSYALKLLLEPNPTPCPCAATQCCYMGTACVTK